MKILNSIIVSVLGLGLLALISGAAIAADREKIAPVPPKVLQPQKPIQIPQKEQKKQLQPRVTVKPRIPIRVGCPDPAAYSIAFRLLSREPANRFRGRVRITGVVKNVGRANYESQPGQQSALLYEIVPGRQPQLVAHRSFQNLAPGQQVQVTYDLNWSTGGEFLPTYRLLISYDPDILRDGNPKNDDCGGSNNQRERSGADIDALFR